MNDVPSGGKFINYKNNTMFFFRTAYGTSTIEVNLNGRQKTNVYSNYGFLVLIPLYFLESLNDPATKNVLTNFRDIYYSIFEIPERCEPKINNFALELRFSNSSKNETILDTKVLIPEFQKIVEKLKLVPGGSQKITNVGLPVIQVGKKDLVEEDEDKKKRSKKHHKE